MHNKQLADQMGVPQEHRDRIDDIHNILEELLKPENRSSDTYHKIEELEYELQHLWGFPKDPSKHTWKKEYLFRCAWAGATLECVKSGERFTIPENVKERDCFFFGDGAMIDVGRLYSYYRLSGCFVVEDILPEDVCTE